jgi:hypothetical protein
MPFTVGQFFDVFETYNTTVWPVQVVAYVLGISAIFLAVHDVAVRSRIVSGILAVSWIWMGIVYQIIHFSRVNPIAELFGILFILQGLILVLVGSILPKLRFRFAVKPIPIAGTVFIIYAFAVYPLIGKAFGHTYPRSPVFGVAPCPSTIFTLGLLLWASRPVPWYVIVIPFLWSLVGVSAAVNLQMPEDYGLGVAGALGAALVIARNRSFQRKEEQQRLQPDK